MVAKEREMPMELIQIAGIAIIATFLVAILRQQRPEQAMAVGLIAGIGILVLVLSQLTPLLDSVRTMLEAASLSSEYGQVLFKSIGVCLLTQIASDTCKDAGEAALAAKTELAGKITLLLMALPLFQKVIELAASLINGQLPEG